MEQIKVEAGDRGLQDVILEFSSRGRTARHKLMSLGTEYQLPGAILGLIAQAYRAGLHHGKTGVA